LDLAALAGVNTRRPDVGDNDLPMVDDLTARRHGSARHSDGGRQ
jgi:hypothetical protein